MPNKVLSMHYDGEPVANHAPMVDPKDIKSMQGLSPSLTSYGHGPPRFHVIGPDVVTVTASGNQFRTLIENFEKYGPVTQIDDHGMPNWRKAGEDVKPSMFNLIPVMPNTAYITGSTPLGMYLPDEKDTPARLFVTPRLVEAVAPNELGTYVSKQANQYSTLRSLLWDDANNLNSESVAWVDFLGRKGYGTDKARTSGIIGLGIEDGDFIAALYTKKGYLVSSPEFHERVSNWAKHYGLDDSGEIEAAKRHVMLHEIAHFLGVKGTRKGEETQGLLQAEFYTMLAENFKGTKLEKIYRALARQGRDYAKKFSLKNLLLGRLHDDSGNEQLENLIEKFEAEAEALELEGKEAADYVNARVKDAYGALAEDEPQDSGKSSTSKKSNSKDLEARVNERNDATEAKSDSKEAPSE